jgi:hypothetical protein
MILALDPRGTTVQDVLRRYDLIYVEIDPRTTIPALQRSLGFLARKP